MFWRRKKPEPINLKQSAEWAAKAYSDWHGIKDPCERAWVRFYAEAIIPTLAAKIGRELV